MDHGTRGSGKRGSNTASATTTRETEVTDSLNGVTGSALNGYPNCKSLETIKRVKCYAEMVATVACCKKGSLDFYTFPFAKNVFFGFPDLTLSLQQLL